MLSPKLETERLILRRYKESDIDAIYDIITDSRLSKYIKFPNLTKDEENKLFFIEEPEIYLHPGILRKFIDRRVFQMKRITFLSMIPWVTLWKLLEARFSLLKCCILI